MSKEELRWRLKEQPSTESLRDLVKDGILSKEEAREILFSKETEDIASLKKEVEVLRDVVRGNSAYTVHQHQLEPFAFWSQFFR